MKPYVFTKNGKGLIEFTERELQKLLDEIHNGGRRDGALQSYQPYIWNPSWTTDKWTITTNGTTTGTTPNYTYTPTSTTGTITLEEKK